VFSGFSVCFPRFFVETVAFFRGNFVKKSDFFQKMIHLYENLRDKMQKTTFCHVKIIKKLKSRKNSACLDKLMACRELRFAASWSILMVLLARRSVCG
jgi:hypothetical protein